MQRIVATVYGGCYQTGVFIYLYLFFIPLVKEENWSRFHGKDKTPIVPRQPQLTWPSSLTLPEFWALAVPLGPAVGTATSVLVPLPLLRYTPGAQTACTRGVPRAPCGTLLTLRKISRTRRKKIVFSIEMRQSLVRFHSPRIRRRRRRRPEPRFSLSSCAQPGLRR